MNLLFLLFVTTVLLLSKACIEMTITDCTKIHIMHTVIFVSSHVCIIMIIQAPGPRETCTVYIALPTDEIYISSPSLSPSLRHSTTAFLTSSRRGTDPGQ
jgi:hypothetical protein